MTMSLIIIKENYGASDADDLHVIVTISSDFIHLHTRFKNT